MSKKESGQDGWIAGITNKQQADNKIGDEGARALSEALNTNTTLQSLDLGGEQEESDEDGWIADIADTNKQTTALEQMEQDHWAKHWRQTQRW